MSSSINNNNKLRLGFKEIFGNLSRKHSLKTQQIWVVPLYRKLLYSFDYFILNVDSIKAYL
ncbi:hypothetical protein BLOT_000234 [Blomia tropicalis]|nr:hypothetical protein BLOT_000234 [Blomia tropicalis]